MMHARGLDTTSWQHQMVSVGSIRLHCVSHGDGPLMLMLHGFPEFWYSWRHQLAEFSGDYHVVAPDMRGYNRSDKPVGRDAYRLDTLVEDIARLIDELGYERCVLVGHDWGAAVAWQFAHTHPDRLERLVIMNVPHPVRFYEGLRSPAQLRRSWYIFFFHLPWLPEWLLGRDGCRPIANLFADQAKNPRAFGYDDLEAFRQAACRPGALPAMLAYYRNMLPTVLDFDSRSYEPIETPTLLIWGEDDAALGKELTHGTDRFVRDLRVEFIPDCSHWVQQDRPATVNRLMREFLATSDD